MSCSTVARLLGGAFLLGGCGANQVTIVNDAGLTSAMNACGVGSGMYVGFVDLIETEFDDPLPAYGLQLSVGASAQFFPSGIQDSAPFYIDLAEFCGSKPIAGQCCSASLPADAGAGVASGEVGSEYVTCLDEQTGTIGSSDQYGGVTSSVWSGDDALQCSADGGVVGPFAVTVSTPSNFAGLNRALFPLDAGPVTVSREHELALTWTAGSASANVVINLLTQTTEVACVAADTGSFTIPSTLLNQFLSGDPGAIRMHRYAEACAQSTNGQVSILVETGISQSVTFQ